MYFSVHSAEKLTDFQKKIIAEAILAGFEISIAKQVGLNDGQGRSTRLLECMKIQITMGKNKKLNRKFFVNIIRI